MIRAAGVLLCACVAVSSAQTQGDSHYARIIGVVADSVSGAPLQGADVQASGVATMVKTDSLGRFTIDSLVPGTYQVAVYHPILESLDITLATQPFTIGRDSAGVVSLAVPSILTLVRRYCANAQSSQTPSVIAGRVLDPDTEQPIENAHVSLAWEEVFVSKTTGIVHTPHESKAETNSSGFFKLCGLPNDLSGTMLVTRGGVTSPELPVNVNGALLDFQNVLLPAKSAAKGDGVVTGRVLSPAGKPVSNARVDIPMAAVSTVTRDDGGFRFIGVPSGTLMVVARSISYSSAAQQIDVTPREPIDVTLTLGEKTVTLDTVVVTARRNIALEKNGFAARKRAGGGHFFTSEDVDRRHPSQITDMLRNLPSIVVRNVTGGTVVVGRTASPFARPCTRVWVDGFEWASVAPGDLDSFVNPNDVIGMEVYQGDEVPSRFRGLNGNCLTLVIWTEFRGKATKQ
ncbi:MAG TPA: carboxypeptidase regulatory-like domain-containing protein [Gemmatimonadaceae bacterium]|nr:carboxypeptidase regulatory-like domain-containing protein [Gemmatimonadaceae bacterium]